MNEKIIDKNNKRIWQNSIGYVPQNIYLADETIASNISFGIDSEKDYDQKEIEKAVKLQIFTNSSLMNCLKNIKQLLVREV